MAGSHFKAIAGMALLVGCKPSDPDSAPTCVGVMFGEDLMSDDGPREIQTETRDEAGRTIELVFPDQAPHVDGWRQWWTYEGDRLIQDGYQSSSDEGSSSVRHIVWDPLGRIQTELKTETVQGVGSWSTRIEYQYRSETNEEVRKEEYIDEELYTLTTTAWVDGRIVTMEAVPTLGLPYHSEWTYDRAAPDPDHTFRATQGVYAQTTRRTFDAGGNLATEILDQQSWGVTSSWYTRNDRGQPLEHRTRHVRDGIEDETLATFRYDSDGRVEEEETLRFTPDNNKLWLQREVTTYTWDDRGLPLNQRTTTDRSNGSGADSQFTWSWDCGAAD